ncbi:MAG: hypothetical protein KGI73_04735 [Patescibacteria group bacterium]|nr:hypothetical protein [Patescibacteria group bacterium]
MAILLEERRPRVNFLSIFSWIVVLAILVAAAYYIFFKNPEAIPFATPQAFEQTQGLSQVSVTPASLIGSKTFQALKDFGVPISTDNLGRQNPFVSF